MEKSHLRQFHKSQQHSDDSVSSSLSDFHDYEPQLEFDDTELEQPVEPDPAELVEYLETPVSDGTIEENFEVLVNGDVEEGEEPLPEYEYEQGEDFSAFSRLGVVEVAGDDSYGRKVIVVSACRLPNTGYDQNLFLRYLMFTLDKYVENDYSLVYFHHGLNRKNKVSMSWLWQAYKAFDRKYKKNLKALYCVHPTKFIKIIWNFFKPAISVKFGKKVMYVNYLHELRQHLHLDQICIPDVVLDYDRDLVAKASIPRSASSTFHTPSDTQQFGVSIQFIKEHHGSPIAPILGQCIGYLDNPDALETEGLFRRSATLHLVKEVYNSVNEGRPANLEDLNAVHLPAVLVKMYLRELPEPILTFNLYQDIVFFQRHEPAEKLNMAKLIILNRLPQDNYVVLKLLTDFLTKTGVT